MCSSPHLHQNDIHNRKRGRNKKKSTRVNTKNARKSIKKNTTHTRLLEYKRTNVMCALVHHFGAFCVGVRVEDGKLAQRHRRGLDDERHVAQLDAAFVTHGLQRGEIILHTYHQQTIVITFSLGIKGHLMYTHNKKPKQEMSTKFRRPRRFFQTAGDVHGP
jgi:hypothetical protein